MCPLCGAFTSFSPAQIIGKGILLDKSRENETQWGKVQISAIMPYDYRGTDHVYAILVCRACEQYFVAERKEYADEWLAVHPIQHKPVAREIPGPIKSEFEEANLCFAVEAYRGSLLVCRTALIAMQRQQGVSNLKELKDNGAISEGLYKQADEVRLWANMIGHEDIPEDITKEDCEQLLTYLEALLNAVYVEPKRLAKLAQKREQLKKK